MLLTLLAACLTSADDYAALQDQLQDADGDGVLGRDDCDDRSEAVHPGLEEIPGDGLDNDCDPTTTDEIPVIETWTGEASAGSLESLYGAGAYYLFGSALALADYDGDGLTDLFASAPRDRNQGTYTGAIYYFSGPWGTGPAEDAPAIFGDPAGPYALGEQLAARTVDGDFTLVMSARMSEEEGAVVLLTDPTSPEFAATTGPADFPSALTLWSAEQELVAATDAHTDGGQLFLWTTREAPTDVGLLLPAQEGTTDDDLLGASLATGDLDGDGTDELLIGSPGAESGAGRVYALREVSANTYAADLWQGSESSGLVLSTGDLNGDGYEDLVSGGATATRVSFGPGQGGDLTRSDVLVTATGDALCASTDVNGDGKDELVLGDSTYGEGGEVLVFYELASALVREDAGLVLRARLPNDAFGASLRCGADIDADGDEDVLIGAPEALGSSARGGVVYLLPGGGA